MYQVEPIPWGLPGDPKGIGPVREHREVGLRGHIEGLQISGLS